MSKKEKVRYSPGDVVEYRKQTRSGEMWVPAMIEACNKRNFRISYEWFGRNYMHACDRGDLR